MSMFLDKLSMFPQFFSAPCVSDVFDKKLGIPKSKYTFQKNTFPDGIRLGVCRIPSIQNFRFWALTLSKPKTVYRFCPNNNYFVCFIILIEPNIGRFNSTNYSFIGRPTKANSNTWENGWRTTAFDLICIVPYIFW